MGILAPKIRKHRLESSFAAVLQGQGSSTRIVFVTDPGSTRNRDPRRAPGRSAAAPPRAAPRRPRRGPQAGPQKCTSTGRWRQGIVSKPRSSLQKSLCPVVTCPYLCSSEGRGGLRHLAVPDHGCDLAQHVWSGAVPPGFSERCRTLGNRISTGVRGKSARSHRGRSFWPLVPKSLVPLVPTWRKRH